MHFEIKDNALFIDAMEISIPHLCFFEEIGSGANANVFLAHNKFLERNEAVKIWHPRLGSSEVDGTRFLEEVKKNANVHFPNVADLYDADFQKGFYYARLEYIPGLTLRNFLLRKQSFATRYRILILILTTMRTVYASGYYHGDLHTNNIIINNVEVPYIIDFGTSCFSGIEASQRRDCTMLLELSLDVLPELLRFAFLRNAEIIEQGSYVMAELISRCLLMIWDFETSNTSAMDTYSYKEWGFRFDTLVEDFPFIDKEHLNEFFAENFTKL
jgi:serine/threonine protein kinase